MDKKRLIQNLGLVLNLGAKARGNYLKKHNIFSEVGENVRFQPRIIPLYPELIKLHNNIMIGAGVRFITHDASYAVLNNLNTGIKFPEKVGCIEIMDNVFVGYNATILPNVRIGENCIIGANTTVTKDLDPNGVYAGTPAKKIGTFDEFMKRLLPNDETNEFDYSTVSINQKINKQEIERAWKLFDEAR